MINVSFVNVKNNTKMEAAEEVEEEIEAVLAIIIEGIDILRKSDCIVVKAQISPLTALDSEQCFVGYQLELSLDKNYPLDAPAVQIRNPRGMSDEQIDELNNLMELKCQEFLGGPVIFELLDLGREFLTQSNIPKAAPCSICLYPFDENDTFCKTKCFHHFHSYCLGRYLKSLQDDFDQKQLEESTRPRSILDTVDKKCEMPCPVCRVDISDMAIEKLIIAPEPVGSVEDKGTIEITPELKMLQNRMKKLFLKQLNIGGIIDKEAEDKRFLIVTSNEDENPETHTNSSLPTSQQNLHACMSNRKEAEITDSSSIPRNGERKAINPKNKERKNRAHRATKLNVRSDRTKLTNNSDAVVSINTNTSINVEACDIEPNQNDNNPPLKNNAYRGGRNKGRRYKPRPS